MADEDTLPKLELLSELPGCRIAADHPDPRGWTVATSDGWEIGHLRDLVVDARTLDVRYLLVELWADLLDDETHSEVLTSADRATLSLLEHAVAVEPDGPDELWLYIGRHYRLAPGPAEARPAPWLEAHDLGGDVAADSGVLPMTALRVERTAPEDGAP